MNLHTAVEKLVTKGWRLKMKILQKWHNTRIEKVPEPVDWIYKTFEFELIVFVYFLFVGGIPTYLVTSGYLLSGLLVALVGYCIGRSMIASRRKRQREKWKREVLEEIRKERARSFETTI